MFENMPTFWRMQHVSRNLTKPNAQSNIFLIVSRASNFKTNFTFIYLESVSLYVNQKLNYMLRKWRHWNITFDLKKTLEWVKTTSLTFHFLLKWKQISQMRPSTRPWEIYIYRESDRKWSVSNLHLVSLGQ